jgi:tetratricopeptide (TPR) repeat protein
MEHEADTWGQDAVIGAFTGGKRFEKSLDIFDQLAPAGGGAILKQDISYAAPCIALLHFEFLDTVAGRLAESGIGVARPLSPATSTHPSNRDRFEAMHAHLSRNAGFSSHTWVSAFEDLLNDIKSDLDRFLDRTGSVGRRLSPRFWRRSRPTPAPAPWGTPIPQMRDDDRILMQKALGKVGGDQVPLDRAAVLQRFERKRDEAHKLYDEGDFAGAERALTRLVEHHETADSVGLYPLLGRCREEIGDRAGAMTAYRRCLEVLPDSDPATIAAFLLGRILLVENNDIEGAKAAFTIAATSHDAGISEMARDFLARIGAR